MKNRKTYYISIILLIGVTLLLNILSQDFFFRWDLTENHRYSLSSASKNIVKNLEAPVTVKAYFSDNMPPNIEQVKQDFRDLLVEYANISGKNLVYEFINPNEDPQIEQQINQQGISPVMINVREKDEVKQQKAYLGAIVSQQDRQEVIPFLQPGESLEYALTTAIKKVSVVNKPTIGLVQGHGEPTMQDMQEVTGSLEVLYTIEPVNLEEIEKVPLTFKSLLIVGSEDTIPTTSLAKIDDYLQQGGNVLVAYNRVKGDLQTASGSAVNIGLAPWLAKKGIQIQDRFLIDAKSASVNVQRQQGAFRISQQIQFPFIPIITNFADQAISKGLESVVMPFVSPITYSGDTTVHYEPLAFSSEKSGTVSVPTYFNIQRQWTQADFPLSNQVVAAALEGPIVDNDNSKMVVISNGNFAVNQGGDRQQKIQPDNLSLFVNSVDWLSDDTGLIDLRTKAVTSRPIDQLEDDTKTLLKYLNFLLPIILVIIIGIIRSAMKKRTRIKRMEVHYE